MNLPLNDPQLRLGPELAVGAPEDGGEKILLVLCKLLLKPRQERRRAGDWVWFRVRSDCGIE